VSVRRALFDTAVLVLFAATFGGCAALAEPPPTPVPPADASPGAFILESTAFQSGGAIPKPFACDGQDQSPPLDWSAPPAGTKGLALVLHDPEAPGGDWAHWVLYDVPPVARRLDAGVARGAQLPNGVRQGVNSAGVAGYSGPCPPPGPAHHYVFELSALDSQPALDAGATRDSLTRASTGHVLATATLTGTYGR